jgi:class III poly(R)-hydroxyalkanoic acid synthase PhaE subunit
MTENPAFTDNTGWLEFQRKYWEAWNQLSRQTLAAASTQSAGANPWADALEHWWKSVSPSAPSDVEDFYTRLIDQAKTFFRLTEDLTRACQAAGTGGESLLDWPQQIEQIVSGMKQALSGADAQSFVRQVMAFWELPLDTWQRTASSLSVLPGDFLQALKSEGLEQIRAKIDERIDRFLSVPAVGYTREWQAELQVQGRLLLDYYKAYQQYASGFAKFGLQCVDRFEQKLKALASDGKAIGSTRELYDLWVDSCEEVYAEYVSTDEYTELHARLVNSLMMLKHHSSAMVDEVLGAMNMPTRREINTLHKRLQELRRDGKSMRSELESLREQLAGVTAVVATQDVHSQETAPASRGKKPKSVSAPTRNVAKGG